LPDKTIPSDLLKSLRGLEGFDEDAFCKVHEEGETGTSVRINPQKIGLLTKSDSSLGRWIRQMERVPWCEWGRWLNQRPSFILDPFWHAGAYYVQEASSMFLSHVLNELFPSPIENLRVLDLCAAPGGKSSLMASHFPSQLIVSNEVIQSRASILTENMTRWGSPNVVVTQNDARDFKALGGFFDLIMVDAPCSGSGLFRKDPAAIKEWSTANVSLCSQRQQRILSDILPALNENGILVYSTCSYSQEEDEEIVDWMIRDQNMENITIHVNPDWKIVESRTSTGATGYRFYPDRIRGEGFFLSCLRKKGAAFSTVTRKKAAEKISKRKIEGLRKWISETDSYSFTERSGNLIAMPEHYEEAIGELGTALRIRKSGTLVGKFAGDELVPDHELAMSLIIRNDIPQLDLDLGHALAYLRKEILPINPSQKGWMLVAHDGLKLGWVKVLDRRINNYYPSSWRILKG